MITNSPFAATPDQLFGPLFYAVQINRVLGDTKTFVDSIPRQSPARIVAAYEREKTAPDFDLVQFIQHHFILPDSPTARFTTDPSVSPVDHINRLWDWLTRPADSPVEGSSKLPLPYPYIVPGGRFREVFYWDSYFTMLGLKQAERFDLLRSMLDNFAYLIDTYGFIPNGNRTYFLSRSQPPFFALMVRLLDSEDWIRYLPQLEQEYKFWMTGQDELSAEQPIRQRVVRLPDGTVLNRYWDPLTTPRPEAYPKEEAAAAQAQQLGMDTGAFYGHNRAACESGWDFSSRWLADGRTLATLRATEIVPVDLNCLLYYLESTLADGYRRLVSQQSNAGQKAEQFEQLATSRQQAIQRIFWNDKTRFFMDYDTTTNRSTAALTLATVFPLFFKLATPEQAQHIHDRLQRDFLQPGGLVTTLVQTGQQWDFPNGWAPLQWLAYQGLLNYGFTETAQEVRKRWLALNDSVYYATGKMMEKYNVVDLQATGGGGSYPNQDGFGWTNGVYLQLLHS